MNLDEDSLFNHAKSIAAIPVKIVFMPSFILNPSVHNVFVQKRSLYQPSSICVCQGVPSRSSPEWPGPQTRGLGLHDFLAGEEPHQRRGQTGTK
jgi:hypothetical protein